LNGIDKACEKVGDFVAGRGPISVGFAFLRFTLRDAGYTTT